MKRIIAWLLVLVMCLSVFTGCKKKPDSSTTSSTGVTSSDSEPQEVDTSALEAALEYVKTIYKNVNEKTARDYQRIGSVPVGTQKFEIVWSVDVDEEYVKVVREEDGMVTIDVNEECTEEVPYVLTATISDDNGNSVSHSWNHILPASSAADMIAIVEAAYQLEPGQSMEYEVTLTGIIISVNTAWSDDYQNITVTIAVEGAEDKPIECYRLKGDGAKDLKVNDIITVTGTLTNYNGKIEFAAGCILDEVIPGEAIEAPSDPKQIVDEAYKLAKNASLPYEATLTGRVISVDTPYDAGYKNITVTIEVEGRENKPIKCYRLKGTDADTLNVNDIITVKGWIKYYWNTEYNYGEIEFDAGCQLLSVIQREAPKQPSDPKVVVDQAYALGKNESLEYEATLTGKIISVDTAYDSSYGNITVTMVVEGRENKPIKCYRMKGTGVDKLKVNDIITVTGTIKHYYSEEYGYGEIEYNYPTLVKYVPGAAETVDPNAKTLTIAEAVAKGKAMSHNTYTSEKYKVTGVITQVYSTTYGNMYIKDDAGNTLTIYGSYSADGSTRYDAMATKPVAGDTVTIYGAVGQYNGTAQIKNGWIIAHTPGASEPEVPDDPVIPEDFTSVASSELAENTAYKLYLEQITLGTTLYFDGTLSSSGYLQTTEDVSKAVDIYMEKVSGGVRFYFMDGETKTYIESYINSDGKNRIQLSTAPTVVYTYNTEAATFVTPLNHPTYGVQDYYFGTYGTYNTIGNSSVHYITGDNAGSAGVTQFIIQFGIYTAGVGGEEPDTPVEPDEPEVPAEPTVVDIPVVGTAYKFGMVQGNVSGEDVYYLIGGMSGYYMATGTDSAAAIDVYLEETEGGYYLYTYVDEAKTYINMVASGTYVNGAYEAAASTVYVYDEASKTVIANINEADYWFGTRNDKTYTTVGPCMVEYEGFYCQFYTVGAVEEPDTPVEPDEPEVPAEPTVVDVPVVGTAYKFGMVQGNVSGEDVYYLIGGMSGYYMATGTDSAAAIDVYLEETEGGYYLYTYVDEVKTYINMVASGTYVNGAYEAVASTVYTYDAESKTVIANVNEADYWFGTRNDKTYTTVGPCMVEYEGFYCQFYTVGTVETPDGSEDSEEPVIEELSIADAIAMGTDMAHNTYTDTKYLVVGEIVEVYNTIYGNMKIADTDGNILTIYGTYDADGTNRYDAMELKPVVGDVVAIYGVVGQYNGTPQIKNGWIVAHVPVLTVADAIALGQSMDHNTYTEVKYAVAGIVTEVYNTTYGNMKITDDEGNVLTLYGTYDADGTNRYDAMESKPVAGDIVVIYGVVGQYNGTAQIKNGWIIEFIPAEDEAGEPEEEESEEAELPAANSVLSVADAIAFGSSMEHNTYTDGKYYVTGIITEVYNETYGNMKIRDEDGNILTIYGTYDADGTNRYDAMEIKPAAGDTVTIYGILGQYNGTAQIKNGWITECTPAEEDTAE